MRAAIPTLVGTWILASMGAAPAIASDTSDISKTVSQYADRFNNNDMTSADALCTDQAIIIDDFAPHEWQGANACGNWWNALAAENKSDGITDGTVGVGKAWHVTVTGDRGYAVYPAKYSFKLNGKTSVEHGVWTFAMQKLPAGWRISGWAWAQH